MLGKTSRTIGALAAMGLVVAGIVATSGSPSGAAGETTAEKAAVTGTLTIELFSDRTGVVKLAFGGDTDGSDTLSQRITSDSACPTIGFGPLTGVGVGLGDAGKKLLEFTAIVAGASAPTVQLPGSYLGVDNGINCGGPAGQIGQGEQLKIELGTYFDDKINVKATSAKLAILRTNNRDGSLNLQFVSPDGVTNFPASPPVIEFSRTGTTTVDTGAIAGGFSGVVLGSTATSNSRGLSLTTVTSFELIGLVSNSVYDTFCSEQVVAKAPGGPVAARAELFRGENDPTKNVGVPCDDVRATVEILPSAPGAPAGAVFWDNTALGVSSPPTPQAFNGTMTINWAPIPAAESASLNRKIDYDGLGTAGAFTDTLWCLSYSATTIMVPAAGALPARTSVVFDAELPSYPGVTQTVARPGNAPGAVYIDGKWRVPWCLVSDSRVLQGSTITQTEVLFGSGDPLRK